MMAEPCHCDDSAVPHVHVLIHEMLLDDSTAETATEFIDEDPSSFNPRMGKTAVTSMPFSALRRKAVPGHG
jgi:hypothetical protein